MNPFYLVDRINKKKEKIIEGELRYQQLAQYLDKLNAPREVWLAEDGSGIVAKVSFDSTTNQLVGLVLPIDENTGMPITFSFYPQTANEIEYQIRQNQKSTIVYLVLAQPMLDNAPSFVLQVFGSDNRFKSENVLNRWKHTRDQLARYFLQRCVFIIYQICSWMIYG